LALLAPACTPVKGPPGASATGIVTSVQGPSAAQVDTFTLRTNSGEALAFTVGRLDLADGGLPAPHLREHLVSGEPITVEYESVDGELLALRYVDAAQ
jgi:hypothetical protein